MAAWLKRFGLHLAAAVGATGVFVAAAAVGANQNRPQIAAVSPPIPIVPSAVLPFMLLLATAAVVFAGQSIDY